MGVKSSDAQFWPYYELVANEGAETRPDCRKYNKVRYIFYNADFTIWNLLIVMHAELQMPAIPTYRFLQLTFDNMSTITAAQPAGKKIMMPHITMATNSRLKLSSQRTVKSI